MCVAPVRIQPNSTLQFGISLLVTPHNGKGHAKPKVPSRITGIQFQGSLESSFRSREIAIIVGSGPSEGGKSLCHAAILLEGCQGQTLSSAKTMLRRNQAPQTHDGNRVEQA